MTTPAAVLIDPLALHAILAAQMATSTPEVTQLGEEETDDENVLSRHSTLKISPRVRPTGTQEPHFADFTLVVLVSVTEDLQQDNVYLITQAASQVWAVLLEFTNSAASQAATGHEVNIEQAELDITEGPELHGNAQAVVTATGYVRRLTGNSIAAVP